MINGNCVKCPEGHYFDPHSGTCKRICAQGEIFFNKKCVCPSGTHKIKGVCKECPRNSYYDPVKKICECNPGFMWKNGECVTKCKYGYEYSPV